MISNAIFMPLDNKKEVLNRIMSCIQECAMNEEEYVTFGMLTDDFKYIDKLTKYLEGMHYEVLQSTVKTIVEDEVQTVCFVKVKWHKERFGFVQKGKTYIS